MVANKEYIIHQLVECYFGNTVDYEREIIKEMFKKLSLNDLENLDLYLDELKRNKQRDGN